MFWPRLLIANPLLNSTGYRWLLPSVERTRPERPTTAQPFPKQIPRLIPRLSSRPGVWHRARRIPATAFGLAAPTNATAAIVLDGGCCILTHSQIGVAGFEPTTSASRTTRASQAALHPVKTSNIYTREF